MAKGKEILLNTDWSGRQLEGTLDGALKPGTCVELTPAKAPVNGRFFYRVWTGGADGNVIPPTILNLNWFNGSDELTAYADQARASLYVPRAGDELNLLVANIAGTGDTFAIGDKMIVQNATGKLIAAAGTYYHSFTMLEAVTVALTADTLCWVQYNG